MLDEQYIRIMGSRLDRFKPISQHRYQCRCPLCGDSKKDKKKARGNFFMYRGSWLYKCHNCGKSMRIPTLLETAFPDLYDEYIMGSTRDRMTQEANNHTAQYPKHRITQYSSFEKPESPKNTLIDFDLPKLSDLPDDHPAVSYARGRKLPAKYLHDLYYAENFKKWSNTIVKDAFADTQFDDARIVIPFRNEKGEMFAFQGRSLKKSKLKYLTVKIDPNAQKIFGLDRIDKTQPVVVVEGPIDSMFLENALGTADSSLSSAENVEFNATFAWDNEPRSPIICKKIEDAINNGSSVVIWKKSNRFKDINDAVVYHNFTIDSINQLVRKRTFQGLEALAELNNWRKA